MRIAIHQPNYAPWLGYFAKLAAAEHFIFLDNVQFSPGGYTNRVRVEFDTHERWLTVPIVHASQPPRLDALVSADPLWAEEHLAKLSAYYSDAPAFNDTWPRIHALYLLVAGISNLAEINQRLILGIANLLGLKFTYSLASELMVDGDTPTERLINLIRAVTPEPVTYFHGAGAQAYHNPLAFQHAGIALEPVGLRYLSPYSVLHTIFNRGLTETALLLRPMI